MLGSETCGTLNPTYARGDQNIFFVGVMIESGVGTYTPERQSPNLQYSHVLTRTLSSLLIALDRNGLVQKSIVSSLAEMMACRVEARLAGFT